MDWNLAIEKNREALKRILALLVAMAGLPVLLGRGEAGVVGDRPNTLPRHLHRFVLRLLRPTEAAARRLIIIAARGLVVELAATRPRKPKPQSIFVRNGMGTGIVRIGSLPHRALLAPRSLSLPLFDPLKRFGAQHRYVKPSVAPRIRSFDDPRIGFFQPPRAPDPLPPSPDDPIDAGRLHRRLEAMASALNDLPRQAKRLARWQARLDVADLPHPTPALRADPPHRPEGNYAAAGAQRKDRFQRFSPMRPGHPPGWRRRPSHAVDEVLNELHGLAVWARERPDTS